ncbi:hypothetical protein [Micromonospora sp. NBC_01796]|uniref:hypothetical protein n=1 Tax=Micromonospora sp. NBC_01796 TaxID=2975987 RepID=UPI002DDB88AC|nr:hypothetical protein [Micromonospora sp. NBC_01796]WSA83282.1 hypothetical protein OIE47_23060 [Micromonospora sp. NBC_01796]
MIRKKSRWFGGALMAVVLTVTGLVASPAAALAATPLYAESYDDYYNGYGYATWSNTGQYSSFQVCDFGAGDARRAVGYIWWQGGGTIERHADGGSGTCSTPVNVYVPAGRWVSMEVCERKGVNGLDEKCGPVSQGVAGS